MFLDLHSSWGSRLKAEWGQLMGTHELHTPEGACLSLAMDPWEEQRGAGVWKGHQLQVVVSSAHSTAHWERGTTAFPVHDLQMLSSILPTGPEPAQARW